MAPPLLDLGQEWHRQRAQLRANHQRPPPLVTAGFDLDYDLATSRHVQVKVAGMALIFGLFPPTLAEFADLARSRLRLGRESARQELQGVLGSRIQALWAWLPTLEVDCYCECDHATGEAKVWLIEPDGGKAVVVDLESDRERLDAAFLAALVLNGNRHWGGADGLARLVARFGVRPLLVAAQVAESLEREPRRVDHALALARARWAELGALNEAPWEALLEEEPPWVCVQLGRLALRLGLARVARHLLDCARRVDVPGAVWSELAQACAQVDDLSGEEEAAARAVAMIGDESGLWLRLTVARVRLGMLAEAAVALARHRAGGGGDLDVIDSGLAALRRPHLPLLQRAHLAGWLAAKLPAALSQRESLDDLRRQCAQSRSTAAEELPAVVDRLRLALADIFGGGTSGDQVESVTRVALLALPFLGEPASRLPSQCAAHALLACRTWAEQGFGAVPMPDTLAVRTVLLDLARLALGQ